MIEYIIKQKEWSIKTFGPGERITGILKHIRKELIEIEKDPRDVYEWVDVIILALDGAWRSGHSPIEIIQALENKQVINFNREWLDWRETGEDNPIEHIRREE